MASRTATDLLQGVLGCYRDLHAHPEIAGEEVRTAGVVAATLAESGLQVTTGVGGHGVVGVLRNGPGPVVLLRAELDALPISERTGLSFACASKENRMHACGHDAHLATLLGAVELLSASRDSWQGTVIAVGQPAEETLAGAADMLADGLYSRFPRPDVALAQHLAPLPAGVVAHSNGSITIAGAIVSLRLHGRGGHAGMPALADNPISTAAAILTAVERLPDLANTTVTCCSIRAGEAANVIPELAELTLSVRAPDSSSLDAAIATVTDLAVRVAGVVRAEVRRVSSVPPIADSADIRQVVAQAHRARFGANRVWADYHSRAIDDFALFADLDAAVTDRVRLVYWMTGCVGARQLAESPGRTAHAKLAGVPANHDRRFAPDPVPTLQTALLALHDAALACLHPVTAASNPTTPLHGREAAL